MNMTATESDTRLKTITRTIHISGIAPIMFDRYAGDNETKLSWQEKIYLKPGTSVLSLPITNINSFFTAHNTNSAPKRLRDARKFKKVANAIQSYVIMSAMDGSEYVPFTRDDGSVIEVGEFGDALDEKSGLYLHRSVARLDKGIPNPKERPVLPKPWNLEFKMEIVQNSEIKEAEIKNLLVDGGIAIGLGTYRGVFGKFILDSWD